MIPAVSVVMPVRDGARFLREAVDSILDQTLAELELIVVDDGSRDATPQILASYEDPRLRLLSARGDGLVDALNQGIEAAQAPYLARMDADDVSLPARVEREVELLERRPDAAFVATWVEVIDEDGRTLRTSRLPERHTDLARRLLLRNPFQHGSVVLRRSIFDRVGRYRDDYGHNEDYDLWRRIAAVAELAVVPEVLYRYREHPAAVTQTDPDRVRQRERLRDELWAAPPGYRIADVLAGRSDPGHVPDQRAIAREALRRRRLGLAAKALVVSALLRKERPRIDLD